MSLSGSIGLVGAVADDSYRGSAYVFRNLDTATGTITQNVKLTASDGAANDRFGSFVSLDGDNFLIGADGKDFQRGKAYSGSVSSVTTLDAGNTSRTISGISFVSQDDWIIGQNTSFNSVTLSASDTANVTASGKAVYISQNVGSDNNTLIINGTLTANEVLVGAAGNGALLITNGGVVSNATAYIGRVNGAQGKVTVEGEDSLWTIIGDLIFGGSSLTTQTTATGELTLADNALVTVSGTTRVHGGGSIHIGAGGTLNAGKLVSNGEVTVTGNLSAASGITLNTGAVLLIAASNRVDDTAAITLSGGTIQRGDGVSETFGKLNLTAASLLDYGTGATGTLTFGTYTPSSLLTVDNFFAGNKLVFSSNLTSTITNSSLFDFDKDFTYNWNGSTFTITAIPEPSAYVAAVALIALMLWPTLRRRMFSGGAASRPDLMEKQGQARG